MDEKDILEHFGIPGMRWGSRKSSSSSTGTTRKAAKQEKKDIKTAIDRERILRSPTRLYKNRHKFTKTEIDGAMQRMKMDRELQTLSRDSLATGSKYANTVLAYGTTASAAYALYKTFK